MQKSMSATDAFRRPGLALALLAGLALAANAAMAEGQIPEQLIGSWRYGNVSLLQYVDPDTGIARPGYSAGASYEFRPDGTYRYAQVLQVGSAPCITKSFAYHEGSFIVNGGSITLNAKKRISSGSGCGGNFPPRDSGPKTETQPLSLGPDPAKGAGLRLQIGPMTLSKG